MSDLICRKTLMRCQTPGMCSPHGGCQSQHDRDSSELRRLCAERDQLRTANQRLALDNEDLLDKYDKAWRRAGMAEGNVQALLAANQRLEGEVARLTALAKPDAELVELLREAVRVLDGWKSTDDLDALQERIDAKLASLKGEP